MRTCGTLLGLSLKYSEPVIRLYSMCGPLINIKSWTDVLYEATHMCAIPQMCVCVCVCVYNSVVIGA